jgi:hypothetical protein
MAIEQVREKLLAEVESLRGEIASLMQAAVQVSTEALTQVELEEGVQNYVLSPLVIAVMSARYNLDDRDLPRSGHAEAGGGYVQAFRGWDPNSGVMPGRPYGWWTDESVGANQRVTLRIDSLPTAADAGALLYLRICRLPLAVASADNLDSSPEIAEEYHLDLLEWAAYRALRNHDVDTEQAEKRDKIAGAAASSSSSSSSLSSSALHPSFAPSSFSFTAAPPPSALAQAQAQLAQVSARARARARPRPA